MITANLPSVSAPAFPLLNRNSNAPTGFCGPGDRSIDNESAGLVPVRGIRQTDILDRSIREIIELLAEINATKKTLDAAQVSDSVASSRAKLLARKVYQDTRAALDDLLLDSSHRDSSPIRTRTSNLMAETFGETHSEGGGRAKISQPGPREGSVAVIERPGNGTHKISARRTQPCSITQLLKDEAPETLQLLRRQQPQQQQQQAARRQRRVQAIESESESESEEDDKEEGSEGDPEKAAAIAEAVRRRPLPCAGAFLCISCLSAKFLNSAAAG